MWHQHCWFGQQQLAPVCALTSMARHGVLRGATCGVGGRGFAERLARKLRNKKVVNHRWQKLLLPFKQRKPKVDRKPRLRDRTHLEYCPAMHSESELYGPCTCFDHLLQTPQSPRMFSLVVRVSTPDTPSAKHLQRTREGKVRNWAIRSDIRVFPERDASDPANDPCARCPHMHCVADNCE